MKCDFHLSSVEVNGIGPNKFVWRFEKWLFERKNVMKMEKLFFDDLFVFRISYLIVSPVYYIMLIESVQSISASDGNLIDEIRDTLTRFLPFSSSMGIGRSRMLPMWKILLPAVALMTGRYICEKLLCKIILPTLNAIREADRYRKSRQRGLAQVRR